MVMSYLAGRRYYPLPYETKRMGSYLLFAVALYAGGMYVENIMGMWLTYAVRIVLLLIYVGVVCTFENVPVLSPFSVAFSGDDT